MKLEQLQTLTGRLHTLEDTLGPPFFPPDVLAPTPAPVDAADAAPNDEEPLRDVTPERFARLEKELVRGKAEVVRAGVRTIRRFPAHANE
jgi:protein regulator of cytokinesis 1